MRWLTCHPAAPGRGPDEALDWVNRAHAEVGEKPNGTVVEVNNKLGFEKVKCDNTQSCRCLLVSSAEGVLGIGDGFG